MRRAQLIAVAAAVVMLSSCGDDGDADAEPSATATVTVTETTTPAPDGTTDGSGRPTPSETRPPATDWPTADVSVPFTGTVPPTPTLVAFRVGTHPDEGLDRVAFEFEGLPGYRAGYESTIAYDGSGEPVDLPGEAFIQIVFDVAQAHDDAGDSTVALSTQPVDVGYPAITAYVLNGDFEGYVSIALGLTGEQGFRVDHFRAENGHDIVYLDVAHP